MTLPSIITCRSQIGLLSTHTMNLFTELYGQESAVSPIRLLKIIY